MIVNFNFDSEVFVAHGSDVPKEGPIPDSLNISLSDLRAFYPELSHWDSFSLYIAYYQYAEDFNLLERDPCECQRNEIFLNYCYWRQVDGDFDPLKHMGVIGSAVMWKLRTPPLYLNDVTACFRCESKRLLITNPSVYKSDENGLLIEGDYDALSLTTDFKKPLKFTCLECGHKYSSETITSLVQVLKSVPKQGDNKNGKDHSLSIFY